MQKDQIYRVVPIKDLKPYERNARLHPDKQVKQIMASIKRFGFQAPILVDQEMGIVAGHGRLEAAIKLGMDEVPCVVTSFLSEEEKRAYIIADNKLTDNSDWDDELLSQELFDLQESGFDDLSVMGFSDEELEDLLPEPIDAEKKSKEDEVPEVAQNELGVKRGDLWILGHHRLLCGDATSKEDVERLMDRQKADIIFTDPPYNHASDEKLVAQSVRQAMKNLAESKWDKYFDFNSVTESLELILADNSTAYVCTSWHLAGQIWDWMKKRSSYDGYCVWHKPNPMPSLMKRHWTWSTELICYATFGKHTFNFPAEGHASNVWSFNKNQKNDLHPTMKPVALIEHALYHSSNAGNLVADIFLGSGSTLIACEKTNRKCFGMEIDEHYCSVIIKRWEQLTGQKAIKS